MNSLEMVRLAKSKPASELTREEVVQLREAVARTPELCQLLGGKEEFERYLAGAPDVTGTSAEEPNAGELRDGESPAAAPGGSRRRWWMTACLAALLVTVAGVWIYRVSQDKASRSDGQPEARRAGALETKRNEDANKAPRAGTPPGNEGTTPSTDDPATAENQSAPPRSETYALFEDEGRFAAVVDGAAGDREVAALDENDRHSGLRSVRLAPANRFRLALERPLPIWENPGEGEYRYLRFAFRKFGGGRVCLELESEHGGGPPIRYDAGQGAPSHGSAHRVWGLELPGEWIVMTCDVASDFGARDITALTLTVPDGEYALFDHVYLARTIDGLDRIAGAPSVELTNQRARRALAKDVLSIAAPAAVRIEANGHLATGVLVGKQGHVLTCGHLLQAMGSDVIVHLADGRTVNGRKAGLCRNADCGVVRIVENIGGLGIELSATAIHTPQDLHVGFSLTPRINDGKVPASYVVEIERDVDEKMLWTDFEMEGAELGGPLVDRTGRVVGIHVLTTAEGRMGFAKLTEVRAEWERLMRDESWGQWMQGTGPMLGVVTTAIEEGSRVDRVLPGSPAAQAGIQVGDVIGKVDDHPVRSYLDIGRQIAGFDPGDTVTVRIQRDGKHHDKRIRLMERQRFPPP